MTVLWCTHIVARCNSASHYFIKIVFPAIGISDKWVEWSVVSGSEKEVQSCTVVGLTQLKEIQVAVKKSKATSSCGDHRRMSFLSMTETGSK